MFQEIAVCDHARLSGNGLEKELCPEKRGPHPLVVKPLLKIYGVTSGTSTPQHLQSKLCVAFGERQDGR